MPPQDDTWCTALGKVYHGGGLPFYHIIVGNPVSILLMTLKSITLLKWGLSSFFTEKLIFFSSYTLFVTSESSSTHLKTVCFKKNKRQRSHLESILWSLTCMPKLCDRSELTEIPLIENLRKLDFF